MNTATSVAAGIVQALAEILWSGPILWLGPHPIFDAVLSWEPEGGYLRGLWGLDHLDDLAVTADAVHDPTAARVSTWARVISASPTGSLMLDMGRRRSISLDPMRRTAAERIS